MAISPGTEGCDATDWTVDTRGKMIDPGPNLPAYAGFLTGDVCISRSISEDISMMRSPF